MPLTASIKDRRAARVVAPASTRDGSATGSLQETATREISCAHCALSVPPSRQREGQTEQFCCAGCETVFQLLRGSGLSDYYEFRNRLGEPGRKVETADARLDEFDSTSFRNLYCRVDADGQVETELLLEGVHCAACVWLVERLPRLEPAVSSSRLDVSRATVTLRFDPSRAPLSRIARTLLNMGYRPRPSRGQEAEKMRRAELRSLLVRVGIAGATAGNVMLMAFALYSGAVGLDEAGTMDAATARFFQGASLIVSLPALFAGGLFFRGAWASLRTRVPHMDLPIAIGIAVAFVWGSVSVFTGQGEIYFDSITALVFFLLIGRYLQRRHQMAESDALELMDAVLPGNATVIGASGASAIAATLDLQAGQRVLVRSGEVVPVDGAIEEGTSALDKSLFSGESRPMTVGPGDGVEAGTLNLGSPLVIVAQRGGKDTRVVSLMRQVERALGQRTPLVHQADRIAGVFTLAVISLAAVVGVFWGLTDPARGVDRALSLLIVACPCALGLATPLSLSAAIAKAARRKQLVFAPQALELSARPSDVVLDKTGTLTEGKLVVLETAGDLSFLAAVASLEEGARHPVGVALRDFAKSRVRAHDVIVTDVTETLGRGISGTWGGQRLVVGSLSFVRSQAELPQELKERLRFFPGTCSPTAVAWGGKICLLLALGDRLRDDAAESLVALKRQGHRLHLLSGDDSEAVRCAAEELSVRTGDPDLFESVQGAVLPMDKLERVRELRERAPQGRSVIMVGDGVNDAGALAAADVGVAVSGATEASKMSADVYLSGNGVSELVAFLAGATRTLRVIRRGIVFSLVYNVLGIAGAACGLLGPLGAAILMPLSSLTVVTNAYRSRTFFQERAS